MEIAAQVAAFPEFGLFADLDEAIVAADPSASVVFANPAAEQLLGWSADDLVGRPLSVLVPPRLIDSHRRGFDRFTHGREMRFTGQPVRLPALRKDGVEVEIDMVLSALERAGSRVVVATLREVDAHAVLDDPIAAADELLALLKTSDGFSTAINRLVATLGRRLGFDFASLWVPDERIGRLRSVALWETATGAFASFSARTREMVIEPNEGLPGRAWVSGVPVWTSNLAAEESSGRAAEAEADGLGGGLVLPIVAEHEVVGVIELFSMHARDLDPGLQRGLMRVCTELGQVLQRRLLDEEAKLERARLELALDAGGMGVWHWDFASNIVMWSDAVQGLVGREGEFVGSVDDFTEVVHPEDRARVLDGFRRALEPGSSRELRLDYRILRDDGEVRWVESRGCALADDHGRLTAMTGVTTDITDRKEGELSRETSHARLDLALEAGRMGVWDWDMELDQVHLSVTLQLEFGFPPRATLNELTSYVHPDDRDRVTAKVLESVKRDGRFQTESRIVRPDGQVRWVANRGMVVRAKDGRVVGMTGVAIDVTEQRNIEARLRRKNRLLQTLNEVGRAVTAHLDLDRVVQMVTDAATELTGAEFGAFFYNVPDGKGGHYLLYALSGAPAESFDRLGMPRATAIFEPTFSGAGVIRLDDVTADPRYGQSAPHHGMPRGHLPVRSYLAVPVVGGDGDVYGGLFFGHPERGRFTESSENLAVGIAAQASIAIANARLFAESRQEIAARQRAYEERDAVARVLQRSLLPPALPATPDLAFGARYAAGSEMVGGDFYDAFPLGGRDWGLVMGDVCGKGPEAAAVTALARYTVRSAAIVEPEPSDVLRFLNDAVLRDPAVDRFCSATFARLHVLNRGLATIQLVHAGHPPALILRADGTVETISETGMLLGLVAEPEIAEHATTLSAGDMVILYTDGVTESRRAEGGLGIQGLGELTRTLAGRSPQEVADVIIDEASRDIDHGHADDMAVLVAQVRGH